MKKKYVWCMVLLTLLITTIPESVPLEAVTISAGLEYFYPKFTVRDWTTYYDRKDWTMGSDTGCLGIHVTLSGKGRWSLHSAFVGGTMSGERRIPYNYDYGWTQSGEYDATYQEFTCDLLYSADSHFSVIVPLMLRKFTYTVKVFDDNSSPYDYRSTVEDDNLTGAAGFGLAASIPLSSAPLHVTLTARGTLSYAFGWYNLSYSQWTSYGQTSTEEHNTHESFPLTSLEAGLVFRREGFPLSANLFYRLHYNDLSQITSGVYPSSIDEVIVLERIIYGPGISLTWHF